MPKPRSSDGTMRRANAPKVLTNRSIVARWIEAETLHLKRLGMSFQAIADHIVEVAHGRQKAMVSVPQDAEFPDQYRISMQGVHRAFKHAINRLPNAEAAELRKLDSERLDDMYLSLQPGIRQGDPQSIQAAVRVLAHHAEINGYKAAGRVEMNGTRVNVLVQPAAGDLRTSVDLSRLTLEELREYRRLEAKTHNNALEVEAVKAVDKDEAKPLIINSTQGGGHE